MIMHILWVATRWCVCAQRWMATMAPCEAAGAAAVAAADVVRHSGCELLFPTATLEVIENRK